MKEAQTVARFNHPGIVAVHTAFKENNTAYMVMEYLQGRTLAELLEPNGGALSEQDAVRYVTAIGQALSEVHEDGVLHRDVKPENVIVTKDGRTVLVDFGAAREFTADVTESIEVVLTPGYAPLEQYGSLTPPGAQADVYALGATLYRLLTGKVPVAAPDRHSGIELEPPGQVNEQVSEKVNESVLKAMATDALDRYQSMDEFLDALTKYPPPQAPPPAVPASPPGRLPPLPRPPPRWPRIAFGVTLLGIVLLGIVMVFMRLFVTPDGPTAPPEDDERQRERAPPEQDGGMPSPVEPALGPVERIYPRIGSLVRQEPADYRTSADSLAWRITFTEAVTNVDSGDFVVTGVKPGRLTVTPAGESDVYDVTIDGGGLADHNGKVTFGFSHGMYIKNLDGNRLLNVSAIGLYQATFALDNAGPLVIFHPASGRIDDADGDLRLTFSEPVYGDASGAAFTAATLAGLIDLRADDESGAPIPFTASIDDNDTVTIAAAGALPLHAWVRVKDAYYDIVGNAGLEATATFTVDTIRPTVTISGVPATDSGAFMATFTFSEAVTGFASSDVAVTNGTASALTEARDGPAVARADYPDRRLQRDAAGRPGDRPGRQRQRGVDQSRGVLRRRRHRSAAALDRPENAVEARLPAPIRSRGASPSARTWSSSMPTPSACWTIDLKSPLPVSTNASSAVEGSASAYDVTFSGSALADHNDTVRLGFLTRGSPDNWISVNVQDTSNRPLPCCGTLGADERTFDVDNVAPRVADIVRSSPGWEHTNEDEVAWTVTFSEPVRNLRAGDYTVSGTDADLTVTPESSGSRVWNVIASGGNLARLNTTIRLSFAGTRDIKDAAGNLLAAIAPTGADENTFVIDSVAPALTSIVRQPPKGSPADAETATWRLTFSEHMRGIDATDFAVHGAKIAVVAAGSKADYDLSVSGEDVIPVRAPISVYINRESDITDLAGNALRVPRPPTTIVLPSSAATPR